MILLTLESIRIRAADRPDGYFEDVLSSGTVIAGDDGQPSHVAIPEKAFLALVQKYDPGAEKIFEHKQNGPGTELKKLLATVGITATPNCSCNARAAEMDRNGIDWCEANIDTIVGWLREEATKRGLPFLDAAGRLLVRRAIHNARKASQADKMET